GVDQLEGRFLAAQLREREGDGDPVIRVATSKLTGDGWHVFVRKGWLAEWRRGRQVASIDLREVAGLPGIHNHQNAAHAYAAARALGLAPRDIEGALQTFPGLRHRCQTVGEKAGLRFVNDSKATNADAAEQALKAFENIRWIAGGVPKAGGIEPLAPLFPRVRKAYLIGEAAESFARTLADHPHAMSGTLQEAFADAVADAEAGDVILLAPACASFDQFASFEARGEAFEALVEAHLADG
ncbi:MAG: glutamate ligase domain-containing protein, partial [Rubricella sp.]